MSGKKKETGIITGLTEMFGVLSVLFFMYPIVMSSIFYVSPHDAEVSRMMFCVSFAIVVIGAILKVLSIVWSVVKVTKEVVDETRAERKGNVVK